MTHATARQQAVESAAHQDALVIGPAPLDDGGEVWAVRSRSRAGQWHRIVLRRDGRLRCTCAAASFGRPCWHRTAVQARLAYRAEWAPVLRQLDRERADVRRQLRAHEEDWARERWEYENLGGAALDCLRGRN